MATFNDDVLEQLDIHGGELSSLTTLTFSESLRVRAALHPVVNQTVTDTFSAMSQSSHDSYATTTDTFTIASRATGTAYAVESAAEHLAIRDGVLDVRVVLTTVLEQLSALGQALGSSTEWVTDRFTVAARATGVAQTSGTVSDTLTFTSSVSDKWAAIASETFVVVSRTSDFITSVQVVNDVFTITGGASSVRGLTEVVVETFTAVSGVATGLTATDTLNDRFYIRSMANSKHAGTRAWVANALGMTMSRLVNAPEFIAGDVGGSGTSISARTGVLRGWIDTGYTRVSEDIHRVRISDVYVEGETAGAALAITMQQDDRSVATPTYTYTSQTPGGTRTGRFKTGMGLTGARARLVLTCDAMSIDKLTAVGGTSNRRT